MLEHLEIQDLAIIDALSIDFSRGFCALTGETGAGKSIIIGALNLILGERASSEDVRSGRPRARVEAVFHIADCPSVKEALGEFDLMPDGDSDQLIVRREVSAQGGSRCIVNGVSAPLWQVRRLGDHLVDLHGQHQHQSLLHVELHREIVDAVGGKPLASAKNEWRDLFARYRQVCTRLAALDRDRRELERRKDLLRYQLEEIEGAGLEPGEDEALAAERTRLEHAESLMQLAGGACELLYEGEHATAAADLMAQALEMVERAARLDVSLGALAERLGAVRADLEDAALQLRDYASGLDSDPARLAAVSDRLHTIGRLKKKYGASVDDILEAAEGFRREFEGLSVSEENREALEAERDALEKRLAQAGDALSAQRRKAAARFARDIKAQLADLEMPDVRFEVRIEREPLAAPEKKDDGGEELQSDAPDDGDTERPRFGERHGGGSSSGPSSTVRFEDAGPCRVYEHGADSVEFLISPNPGEDLRPLRRIASGGELSRIMLALKVILSGREQVPTLVFDEIDTGISGRTGARIGEKMAALGQERQLICITHLAQIAARAERHYAVRKGREGNRTLTRVEALGGEARELEIARLLGGEVDSAVARKHAGELLARASQ